MTDHLTAPSDQTRAEVRAWFDTLQRCVRAVDYATARDTFDPDVVSFGTRAAVVHGLDILQAEQWSGVWPMIADFAFDLDQIEAGGTDDIVWAVVTWTSTGFHEDGTPFPRPGRATVTFARRNGRLLATHTHFSLTPGTPPRSYGRRS
jgi:ketosteroid isomerase-like protein